MGWKDDRKKYFVLNEQVLQYAKKATAATSTNELAKICQRMYIADYINLEGIDLYLAKHALTAVYRVLKQYPALRGEIHYFGTLRGFAEKKDALYEFLYKDVPLDLKQGVKRESDKLVSDIKYTLDNAGLAVAFLIPADKYRFSGIIIDENDFDHKSILLNLEEAVRQGFNPVGCSTVKSVVDHELGHLLDYWLNVSNDADFKSNFDKAGPFYIEKHLSQYPVCSGRTNYAEALAEGFAEAQNNSSPRKIACYVKRKIDEAYAQKIIELDNKDKHQKSFADKIKNLLKL